MCRVKCCVLANNRGGCIVCFGRWLNRETKLQTSIPVRCCSLEESIYDVRPPPPCSVGSGAISIGEALVVAAIFEFLGAFFLGAGVTDTVRKNIAN